MDGVAKGIGKDLGVRSGRSATPGNRYRNRSLCHSLERPARNIDTFVSSVLNCEPIYRPESGKSGKSVKCLRNLTKTADHFLERGSKGGSSFQSDSDEDHIISRYNLNDRIYNYRSRNLKPEALRVNSEPEIRDYSSSENEGLSNAGISTKSDLLHYRGRLAFGVHSKQSKTDLASLRRFDRSQEEAVRRVKKVFEKSNQKIRNIMLDMKVDMVTNALYRR